MCEIGKSHYLMNKTEGEERKRRKVATVVSGRKKKT